jgi:hypothetical protein
MVHGINDEARVAVAAVFVAICGGTTRTSPSASSAFRMSWLRVCSAGIYVSQTRQLRPSAPFDARQCINSMRTSFAKIAPSVSLPEDPFQ